MSTQVSIEADYEVFVSSNSTPERLLLAATLERAWRDLSNNVHISETRQAVAWFEDRGKKASKYPDLFISFQQCVDGLELAHVRILHLREEVEIAKQYLNNYSKDKNCLDTRKPPTSFRIRVNKSLQKRETCRESRCALVA